MNHTLNIPYTLIQPVIPGKQVTFKTPEEQAIQHYKDLILSIMKAMDLQYITHYTDNKYQLITIHRADDMLGAATSNGIISNEVFTHPYN